MSRIRVSSSVGMTDPSPLPSKKSADDEYNESFKETFTFFMENTTAHGLGRVLISSNCFKRVIWAVLFTAASIYFAITLHDVTVNYLAYEVSTSIEIRQPRFGTAEFPAVTVCNLNKLKSSKIKDTSFNELLLVDTYYNLVHNPAMAGVVAPKALLSFNKSAPPPGAATPPPPAEYDLNDAKWSEYLDFAAPADYSDDQSQDYNDYGGAAIEPFTVDASEIYSECTDAENTYLCLLQNAKTFDLSDLHRLFRPYLDELDKYGHKVEDLILQCTFDGKDCFSKYVNLSIVQTHSDMYGNCFTLNSQLTEDSDAMSPGGGDTKPLTTTRWGSMYGLRMTLNIEPYEYVGMFSHDTGARVAVHDPRNYPFPEQDGYLCPIGQSTQVGIETTLFVRKEYPYVTDCYWAAPPGVKLSFPGRYTQQNCLTSCYYSEVVAQCGCTDSAILYLSDAVPASGALEMCSFKNSTQIICRQLIAYLYRMQRIPCMEHCHQACYDKLLKSDVSSTNWPSTKYSYILLEELKNRTLFNTDTTLNFTLNEIQDNLARVHVYMKTLDLFVVKEDAAYDWLALVSDVGGTLGLFIGLSVLTAVEIVELLIDITIVGIKKCYRAGRRNVRKSNAVRANMPVC